MFAGVRRILPLRAKHASAACILMVTRIQMHNCFLRMLGDCSWSPAQRNGSARDANRKDWTAVDKYFELCTANLIPQSYFADVALSAGYVDITEASNSSTSPLEHIGGQASVGTGKWVGPILHRTMLSFAMKYRSNKSFAGKSNIRFMFFHIENDTEKTGLLDKKTFCVLHGLLAVFIELL